MGENSKFSIKMSQQVVPRLSGGFDPRPDNDRPGFTA